MHDSRLNTVKESRNKAEYYFTIKSFFMSRVLDSLPEGMLLTYLDADLFLFSRVDIDDPVFLGYSILLSPHRFPPAGRFRERFGLYNAGMIAVRRDVHGKAFLAWWREQCIDWCLDRVQDGRYADQKYLDEVPGRFGRVGFFVQKGINLAPWNLGGIVVELRGDKLVADGDPLMVFHFHGLRALGNEKYDSNARNFKFRMTPVLRERIYKPYVIALKKEQAGIPGYGLSGLSIERHGMKKRGISMSLPGVFNNIIRWIFDLYYNSTFLVSTENGESHGDR